ncbi:MAG TPA: spore coat biosynthesis protein F [Allosphingosinicella sp.]|jgi:hypothetical protein
MSDQPTILVLAGQRPNKRDPLAAELNISHKCMAPVLGIAAIGRVLTTIHAALPKAKILLSIEDPGAVAAEPTVARLAAAETLGFVGARANLVDSVIAASETASFPLLITTGDNALLTEDALHAVTRRGMAMKAGSILVLAPREAIEAAHPGGKGRYYEFRDGAYSNCNLFWISDKADLRGAEAFRAGGQFLKVKGRMLDAFGALNLLFFKLKLLAVESMFKLVSRRLKTHVEPLILPDGRLAIDVDDMRSLRMAEDILAAKLAA